MDEPRCLLCKAVPLSEVGPFDPRVAFFECPRCRRQYALRPGQPLTFRWLHPVSLALYPVQFDESPSGRAAEVAAALVRGRPAEQSELFAREIRLELDEPTLPIGAFLECRASEGELRAFLGSVAREIEALLAIHRAGPQGKVEPSAAADGGGK
jgi:hypothetical protein